MVASADSTIRVVLSPKINLRRQTEAVSIFDRVIPIPVNIKAYFQMWPFRIDIAVMHKTRVQQPEEIVLAYGSRMTEGQRHGHAFPYYGLPERVSLNDRSGSVVLSRISSLVVSQAGWLFCRQDARQSMGRMNSQLNVTAVEKFFLSVKVLAGSTWVSAL